MVIEMKRNECAVVNHIDDKYFDEDVAIESSDNVKNVYVSLLVKMIVEHVIDVNCANGDIWNDRRKTVCRYVYYEKLIDQSGVGKMNENETDVGVQNSVESVIVSVSGVCG